MFIALALLAVAPLPIDPEQHVGPEEQKDPENQHIHESLGDPHLREALVIVHVAVGMEAQVALGGVLVTLTAGLQAVVVVDLRARVLHRHDPVASVTVETLGSMGIAQSGHLSVIGGPIGLDLLLVATPTVLGNGELDRILLGRVDIMGGMAIGADRRVRVVLFQHGLTMDRGLVGVLLLLVAAPADLRVLLPVLRPLDAADGADVMRIVTVVAGGVGTGLILQIRSRVDRAHIAVDLGNDHVEPLVLGIVAAKLLLPFLPMALHAADALGQWLVVLGLGDAVVATDAGLLAVNAGLELVLVHIDVDDGPVLPLGGLLVFVRVALKAAFVGNRDLALRRLGIGPFGGRRGAAGAAFESSSSDAAHTPWILSKQKRSTQTQRRMGCGRSNIDGLRRQALIAVLGIVPGIPVAVARTAAPAGRSGIRRSEHPHRRSRQTACYARVGLASWRSVICRRETP